MFMAITVGIGFVVEVIGVNTALLFGEYTYGNVLGIQVKNVPLIIGVNWFIVMYCCGITTYTLFKKALSKLAIETKTPTQSLKAISVIIDGATIAVFLDWIMEPVAIKLGYWHWKTDVIPFYNYLCWFVVSVFLLILGFVSHLIISNTFLALYELLSPLKMIITSAVIVHITTVSINSTNGTIYCTGSTGIGYFNMGCRPSSLWA